MASTSESSTPSDFYFACRNGLIDQVREQLPNMSLEEIDRVQPNHSTALHAACYYGHKEIVELLLERGASRSIPNKHKCLPYDEAENDEIKKLFLRRSTTRFSNEESGHIDWMKCDAAAEKIATEYRFRHNGFGWTSKNIDLRMKHIKEDMSHTEDERISVFLKQVQTDPYCLLRAYTAETDFYDKLNKDLATRHFDGGTNFGITYFIDFFYNNPAFENLSFKGKVYRGMCMTHDDLKQYSVGGKVMNKAFLSTTKDPAVAKAFATKGASNREKQHGGHVKLSVFCTYEIINDRSGLNIEAISEYGMEKEVLVGPYIVFTITHIRQVKQNYVEIDLRECEKANDGNDDDDDDDDY